MKSDFTLKELNLLEVATRLRAEALEDQPKCVLSRKTALNWRVLNHKILDLIQEKERLRAQLPQAAQPQSAK